MNKREAKRYACWDAAVWIETALEAGAEYFGPLERDSKDGQKVEAAMEELIAELLRRGWE